jgi:hypothetical protein
MTNSCGSNGFYINGNQCMYYGKKIPNPPRFNKNNINLATINNKVYLNGFEYFPKTQKWKRTPKALWHLLSNIFW